MSLEVLIRNLSGLHKGQDFVIFGNGPSLLEHRERLAAGLPCRTFGLNRSWLLYDADYHTSNDRVHVHEIERGHYLPRFLFVFEGNELPRGVRGARYTTIPHKARGRGLVPQFSIDASRGISMGVTPIVAMQLAAWMGAKRILLLGIDLKPDKEGRGHFYDALTWDELGFSSEQVAAMGFRGGIPPWYSAPIFPYMPKQQIPEFMEAKRVLDNAGIEVLNLNPDSLLDVFEKTTAAEIWG